MRWSPDGAGGTTGAGPWVHGVIGATSKWGPQVSLLLPSLLLPELVKTRRQGQGWHRAPMAGRAGVTSRAGQGEELPTPALGSI